jgi:DNA-binding response OmpR family regulator
VISSENAIYRPGQYRDLHLEMNFVSGLVSLDSRPMVLSRKEYQLLSVLVQNAGELVSRDALLLTVWGYGEQIRTRTLDVHIYRLRIKLGDYGNQYIETIFGDGYRFRPFFQISPSPAPAAFRSS